MNVLIQPNEGHLQIPGITSGQWEAAGVLIGLAVLVLTAVLVCLAVQQVRATRRQSDVIENRERRDRAASLIGELGARQRAARLKAIRGLEALADETPSYRDAVFLELTRQFRIWADRSLAMRYPVESPEVHLILVVLGRRPVRYGQGEGRRLNLSGTNMRGLRLPGVHLEAANLSTCALGGDPFGRNADLTGAWLDGALFNGGDLRQVQLRGASLPGCSFVGADLRGIDLRNTDVRWCDFDDADMTGAVLYGADLRFARGLAKERLDAALIDSETRLPKDTAPYDLDRHLVVRLRGVTSRARQTVKRFFARAA